MHAVQSPPDLRPSRPDLHRLSEGQQALLAHLRIVCLTCRAKRRADLFKACAMLSGDKTVARAAHADVLMRCLSQAVNRQPVFFRPGETELSFDESWLVTLATALARGDEDSATFLLKSRVAPHAQRNLAFLISAVSEEFGLI